MYLQGQKENVRKKTSPARGHVTLIHKIQNLNFTIGLKYFLPNSRVIKIANSKM